MYRFQRTGSSRVVTLLAGTASVLVAVAVGASIMAIWWQESVQEVAATLRIQRPDARSAASFDSYRSTQLALLQSPLVIGAAAEAVGHSPILSEKAKPVEWLASQLRVNTVAGSELVRVSLRHRNTREAQRIIDSVVDAYVSVVDADVSEQWRLQEEMLREQQLKLTDDIDKTVQRIGKLESTFGGGREDARKRVTIEIMREQRSRLDETLLATELSLAGLTEDDLRRSELEAQKELLEAKLAQNSKQLEEMFELQTAAANSPDLEISRLKLQRLKDLVLELDAKLQHVEIEAAQQPRVQVLQRASVTKG